MLRCLSVVGVLGVFAVGPVGAGEKNTWQDAELKKLQGRWTTVREEKTDRDKVRRTRLELEFTDGRLTVYTFDEKGAQSRVGPPLIVTEIQRADAAGAAARLKLERAEVYYDFVGEKLIVVGGIAHRPFEGLKLSGEYKRAEKPK